MALGRLSTFAILSPLMQVAFFNLFVRFGHFVRDQDAGDFGDGAGAGAGEGSPGPGQDFKTICDEFASRLVAMGTKSRASNATQPSTVVAGISALSRTLDEEHKGLPEGWLLASVQELPAEQLISEAVDLPAEQCKGHPQRKVIGFNDIKCDMLFCHLSNKFPSLFDFKLPQPVLDLVGLRGTTQDGVDDKPTPPCSSVEQGLMLTKAALMNDMQQYDAIAIVADPVEIQRLGREVRKVDEQNKRLDFDFALWDRHVKSVVDDVVRQRFTQDDDARQVLLSTGSHILAQAMENNDDWGIGELKGISDQEKLQDPTKWEGTAKKAENEDVVRGPVRNLLGAALMRERRRITEQKDPGPLCYNGQAPDPAAEGPDRVPASDKEKYSNKDPRCRGIIDGKPSESGAVQLAAAGSASLAVVALTAVWPLL